MAHCTTLFIIFFFGLFLLSFSTLSKKDKKSKGKVKNKSKTLTEEVTLNYFLIVKLCRRQLPPRQA